MDSTVNTASVSRRMTEGASRSSLQEHRSSKKRQLVDGNEVLVTTKSLLPPTSARQICPRRHDGHQHMILIYHHSNDEVQSQPSTIASGLRVPYLPRIT